MADPISISQPPTHRIRTRLRLAGLALITAVGLIRIGDSLPQRATEFDFSHYYIASHFLLEGRPPYATSMTPEYARYGFTACPQFTTSPNPPLLLWLFASLAWLPPPVAFAIWVAGEVLCLAVILLLTWRLLRERLSTWSWLGLIAGVSISPILLWHFNCSQVQLLLAALVLLAFYQLGEGRDTSACLIIAAAGLLKLYPFALLPWFIWRSSGPVSQRWRRAILVTVAASAVVWASGIDLWMDYFRHGMPSATQFAHTWRWSFTCLALFANLAEACGGLASSHGFWPVFGLAVGLGLIGLIYLICLRLRDDRETQFCLLSIVMLVGNVTAWGHYLVFLIFPVAVAATRLRLRPSWGRTAVFGMLVLVVNNFFRIVPWSLPFHEQHPIVHVLLNYCPLFGEIGLGIFLILTAPANGRHPGRCCTS